MFNRKSLEVAARFIYALVFQVDSQHGWSTIGPEEVPYDVNGDWDAQISVDREAYAWTQKFLMEDGMELSKLPKAGGG